MFVGEKIVFEKDTMPKAMLEASLIGEQIMIMMPKTNTKSNSRGKLHWGTHNDNDNHDGKKE